MGWQLCNLLFLNTLDENSIFLQKIIVTKKYLFLRKLKDFRKEKFIFSSRSFFPIPDFAHDAQNRPQNSWCLLYYMCEWEARESGFESLCRP